MDLAPELATIPGANQWIMNRQRNAIAALLGSQPDRVAIQGHTDLTIDGRKFSGNSQRRRRLALLFHGTFLLNFDLNLIGRLLRFPSAQPDYRLSRGHADFVVNLGLPRNQVEAAIHAEWDAHEPATLLSSNRHDALFAERYSIADWHLKR